MAIRLLLDSDGLVVNRILLEPGVEYNPSPLVLAPEGVDGEIGGIYINGVYSPQSNIGVDQEVHAGSVVQLDGSNSIGIAYLWSQVAGELVVLSDVLDHSPSFTAPNISGRLIFELIVSNGHINVYSTVKVIVEL